MRSRSRRRPRSVGRESAGRSFSRETFILRDAGDVRRRGKKHRTRQYNNVLPSPCGHRPQAGTETLRTRTGRSRCLPEHKMPWVSREVCSSPLWVSICPIYPDGTKLRKDASNLFWSRMPAGIAYPRGSESDDGASALRLQMQRWSCNTHQEQYNLRESAPKSEISV